MRRCPDFVSTATRRLALPSYAPAIRGCATPLRISTTLCRCITEHCCSFAFDRRASRRHAIAMQRLDLLISSIAPLSHDAPLRCIAFQSRRRSNLGGTLPSPCLASLCFALPSPGPAPQSNAFAARISPSPLHAAALLRHNGAVRHLAIAARCVTRLCRRHSKPVPAWLFHASAHRFVAGHGRATQCLCVSVRCRSFTGPCVSLLLLRRSSPSCACPSPSEAQPCISVASPGKANLFLRSSRLSRASPSPGCAPLGPPFPSPT